MGCRNGEASTAEETTASASGNALLIATVSAVGLPVEVKVKDGSLYSGVFHTASIDDGFGIVLKKAMMIGRGRCCSGLDVGDLVDTLIVLSKDLVQVIVKDFLFPMEGDICYSVGDHLCEGMEIVDSSGIDATSGGFGSNDGNKSVNFSEGANIPDTHHVKELKSLDNNHDDFVGRDGLCREEVEEQSTMPVVLVPDGQIGEIEEHAQEKSRSEIAMATSTNTVACADHYSTSCCVHAQQAVFINENQDGLISGEKRCRGQVCLSPGPEGYTSTSDISAETPSSTGQISNISSSLSLVSSDGNSSCSNVSSLPNIPASEGHPFYSTCMKDFKLNPEAKQFFPSVLSSRSVSAAIPNIVNTSYVSSIPPAMPIGTAQSSFEINSFPSCTPLPTKFVQYSPLATGQIGVNAQYSRPISGQVNTRQQAARFFGQYHPVVQTGSTYMHQQAQPVMVGRAGQLVYVHPISQDPMQGTTVFSQGFPIFTPCQPNLPKFEGTPAQSLHYCINPPLIAAGPALPFAVACPAQFPPVPTIQPVTVPGGNGFCGGRYL